MLQNPIEDFDLQTLIQEKIARLSANGWTTTHNEDDTITIARTFTPLEIIRIVEDLPCYLVPERIPTVNELIPASRQRNEKILEGLPSRRSASS